MTTKPIVVSIALVGIVALAVWGYLEGRGERVEEAEREQAPRVASRVTQIDGETVVVFDAASRTKSGIVMSPQAPVRYQRGLPALALVLPLDDLITVRSTLAASTSAVDTARAAVNASQSEYHRLATLHSQEQPDISEKALQAAEAVWRADDAGLRTARAAYEAAQQIAHQRWGAALTQAAMQKDSLFEHFIKGELALLRITLPADVSVTQAPHEALIQLPGGETRSATLIAASPRSDPRLQGVSFFYAAPGAGLTRGTTLSASLPVGPDADGIRVPHSAVVWWQGRAWIYTQHAPDQWLRRELPADSPVEGGWFVPSGFGAGEPIVTIGAQLLLSEEQRAQISVGEAH